MTMEEVVVYLNEKSLKLPGGSEDNHENKVMSTVSRPAFKPATPRMRCG
jgi:hypothetical protein